MSWHRRILGRGAIHKRLLGPATVLFSTAAGFLVVAGATPWASGTCAFVAAVVRMVDLIVEYRSREKRLWQHVDVLLVSIGEALDHKARVSLHLAKDQTLHCERRWTPNNGCSVAKRPRKPLKSGIGWSLAFEPTLGNELTLSTGLIPEGARKTAKAMKAWHKKNGRISDADAENLGEYLQRVASIECVKLTRADHGTIGILTIDSHASELVSTPAMEQVTRAASVLQRILVDRDT